MTQHEPTGSRARDSSAEFGLAIGREQRARIERENLQRLEQDLRERRLVFASRPYEASLQFSNYCNMSCIMCWDGANPRVQRMSEPLLRQIEHEIAPSLSRVTPYFGSEPLILTWDDTRRLAMRYSIQLNISTNLQYLDEARFRELEDITETLSLSIDSHIPQIYAQIRPGSDPARVFANLPVAARLAREHGIECAGHVVLLAENAAQLAETVAFLGDSGLPTVNVVQLIDFNGRSSLSDPLQHFSAAYIAEIRRRCIEVCREKQMRLIWSIAGLEVHDFRSERIGPAPRKVRSDAWDARFRRLHPRYCRLALSALRVDTEGAVAPCFYATDGDLSLGRLGVQSFEQIWNGPDAQDLRRGMSCGDVPALCRSCRMRDPPPTEQHLPFIDHVDVALRRDLSRVNCDLESLEPAHMTRLDEAPLIRVAQPSGSSVDSYFLALSRGGEADAIETCALQLRRRDGEVLEFEPPSSLWDRLESNRGYWWVVYGCVDVPGLSPLQRARKWAARVLLNRPEPPAPQARRSAEIRCLIRHEALARVSGSRLRYADQGELATRDLGGEKQPGFTPDHVHPERPKVLPLPPVAKSRHFATELRAD